MSKFIKSVNLKSEYDLELKECNIISLCKEEKNTSPHIIKQRVECDLCGSYHVSKYDIKRHLKIHLNDSEKTEV